MDAAERYARENMGVRMIWKDWIWTRDELIAWYGMRGCVKADEKPFPYGHLENGTTLRGDSYFRVLRKLRWAVRRDIKRFETAQVNIAAFANSYPLFGQLSQIMFNKLDELGSYN